VMRSSALDGDVGNNLLTIIFLFYPAERLE
jgi:hypothetical protein